MADVSKINGYDIKDTTARSAAASKSVVTASATGTSTTEAGYITIDGTEWKLPAGTSESDLFWCTYGTTSPSEIASAISDGKLPVCWYYDDLYVISANPSGGSVYTFTQIVNVGGYLVISVLRCSTATANYWSSTNTPLRYSLYEMAGATSSTAGTKGLVPAPAAGDNEKFLRGDGTWAEAGGSGGSQMYLHRITLRLATAGGSTVNGDLNFDIISTRSTAFTTKEQLWQYMTNSGAVTSNTKIVANGYINDNSKNYIISRWGIWLNGSVYADSFDAYSLSENEMSGLTYYINTFYSTITDSVIPIS